LKYCTGQIFGWTFDCLDDFGNRFLAEKHLKDCSRLYPGFPLLQECMLLIRSSLNRRLTLELLTFKQAHGVFVEIVKCTEKLLNQMQRQTPGIFTSKEIQRILSRWDIVSSVL
jgi:hypothetical protein